VLHIAILIMFIISPIVLSKLIKYTKTHADELKKIKLPKYAGL